MIGVLNQHIGKALASPAVNQALTAQGFELAHGSAAELSMFFREEIAKWGEVIRASGAKVE